MPQTKLWEMATYEMKPRLNRLEGVSTVIVQGGQEPEFHITPDPAKLLTAGVTVSDILDAVRRTNLIDSPGLLERNHQLYLGLGQRPGAHARRNRECGDQEHAGGNSGADRRCRRVAPGVKPVYTVVTANGKPAVLLNINRQPDGNTVQVAQEVHDEIESLRKTLPPGIQIQPFYDQSIIVDESIKSVRDAILLGLILASIILVVFLRDWGTSLVAGLVIPVTVMVTFIALKVMGQTFNLMTLGGLAAAVGLVIDDAIVVVENIVLHRDAGQGRLEAIHSALKEITIPLIGSTITPSRCLHSADRDHRRHGSVLPRAGRDHDGIAADVAGAGGDLDSDSEPVLHQGTPRARRSQIRKLNHPTRRLREPHQQRIDDDDAMKLLAAEEKHLSGFFLRVVNFHERWLRRALERPRLLVIFSAGLIVVSYVCYTFSGSDLLPEMDEGGFVIDYIMPAGSSLAETNRVVSHVEQMLRELPEVESTSRRTGLQLGLAAVTEANTGDILVKLKAKRDRDIDDIMADVRADIKKEEPALDVEFIQVLQDMIGDLTSAPEPIQIKLFSQDPKQLEAVGAQGGRGHRKDQRRRRPAERDRQHDQRARGHFSG